MLKNRNTMVVAAAVLVGVMGTPVVLNAGMRGDRGFVIFSAAGEISAFIKTGC